MFTFVSVKFSTNPATGEVSSVELTDSHDCVHFLPYPVYLSFFQQVESAEVPEMNDPVATIVQHEEGQDAFTGAFGLTTLYADGTITFQAYEGSYSYTVEDGRISASLETGNEFHSTTQDFYNFMRSPIGFEHEVEEDQDAFTAYAVDYAAAVATLDTLYPFVAPVVAPVAAPELVEEAPVAPVAPVAASELVLDRWSITFRNSLQRSLIGADMRASLSHYTRVMADEADEVFNRFMAMEVLPVVDAQHLNQAVLVKKPFDEILTGLKANFTRNNADENTNLFAYSLFHLANSKLVGASPAEKWAILCDLFLPPVA